MYVFMKSNWIRERRIKAFFERNKIFPKNFFYILIVYAYILTAILLFYVAQECWDKLFTWEFWRKFVVYYCTCKLSVVVVNVLFLIRMATLSI